MGALLVPLAILAGASFDSLTKAPDAVANVIESAGVGEPQTVAVTTTVVIPVHPQWTTPDPAAAAAPDAIATPSPAEQPAVAVPQQTIGEALNVEPCVTTSDNGPRAPKEPPAASMSVDVLPGRSGPNDDGHRESRPGRPVRCG